MFPVNSRDSGQNLGIKEKCFKVFRIVQPNSPKSQCGAMVYLLALQTKGHKFDPLIFQMVVVVF